MSDILLAAGCSYTDKNYTSWDTNISDNEKGGWDFWPEIVGKQLGLRVVNKGQRGRGNIYILEEIIKSLVALGNKVKVVMILWSDIDRISLPRWDYDITIEAVLRLGKGHPIVSDEVWDFTQLIVNYFNKNTNQSLVDNHLANIKFLHDYCKANNIKIIMAQGIGDMRYESIIQSEFFQDVENIKQYIIGWPFTEKLNGYIIANKIPKQYNISEYDKHPNAEGQRIIADLFLNKYKETLNEATN